MYELVRVGHSELVGGVFTWFFLGLSALTLSQRSFESMRIRLLFKSTKKHPVSLSVIQSSELASHSVWSWVQVSPYSWTRGHSKCI